MSNSILKGMTNPNLLDIIKFLKTVGMLKKTPRAGWVEVGVREPESVADHMFRTSVLCMLYSDLEGLNKLKLLRLALIHDLPEAILGDLTPSQKAPGIEEKENAAMSQMLSFLPRKQKEKYMAYWREYQEGVTLEAQAVKQLEKLEMALQAKEYEEVWLTKRSLGRFMRSAKEAIIWPQLRRLLSCILEEHKR